MNVRTLRSTVAAAVAAASAAAVFLVGFGTALAPEPAKLSANLSGGNGANAVAVYVNSQAPTRVMIWSGSIYAPNGPAVGTPCSPVALRSGATTTSVIVDQGGGYRRCLG
jgi:hypothetical protein